MTGTEERTEGQRATVRIGSVELDHDLVWVNAFLLTTAIILGAFAIL